MDKNVVRFLEFGFLLMVVSIKLVSKLEVRLRERERAVQDGYKIFNLSN